ncbi:class C sortase [Bifidobacterium scaligerum]|nr:class C sortase [Bifidobacterium scaligerum]
MTTAIVATGSMPTFHELILGLDNETMRLKTAYRNARRRSTLLLAFGLTVILAGLGAIGYPIILRVQSSVRDDQVVARTERTVNDWPYPQAEDEIKAAQLYNQRLAGDHNRTLGEATDPFSSAPGITSTNNGNNASARDDEYMSLLDAGDNIMGSILIPKISVNLPIYHGTSDAALAAGSGHLYGTSLPVGGPSTHSVLTGHRGLVQAMMFTRLDELKIGDTFYIKVMGEQLGYKIDRISVIEPNDLSQFTIKPGEDRVTLMTCTPYGVNTHRLLVSGIRAAIPGQIPEPAHGQHDPRTIMLWSLTGACSTAIIGTAIVRRRNQVMPIRHRAK